MNRPAAGKGRECVGHEIADVIIRISERLDQRELSDLRLRATAGKSDCGLNSGILRGAILRSVL